MNTYTYTGHYTEHGKKLLSVFAQHQPKARKIKPLPGQVLIEVEPPPEVSAGGVALPNDLPVPPDVEQENSRNPEKPSKNNIGRVVAVGAWPKTRKGLLLMPEFGPGQRVLFNPWRGTQMERAMGEKLRMIEFNDVLAVLT